MHNIQLDYYHRLYSNLIYATLIYTNVHTSTPAYGHLIRARVSANNTAASTYGNLNDIVAFDLLF
jgi:hypothetical protein